MTLSNERVMLSSSAPCGDQTSAAVLLDLVRAHGGVSDRGLRQRLAMLHCESEVLRLNRLRTLSAGLAGRTLRPERVREGHAVDARPARHGGGRTSPVRPGCSRGRAPPATCPSLRTGPTEVNVNPDHCAGRADLDFVPAR